MPNAVAVQVTIYLNESDKWKGRPLHMAILNYLHDENVFAACTMHAVGGFLGRQRVKTSHLVDAGADIVERERPVELKAPDIVRVVPSAA